MRYAIILLLALGACAKTPDERSDKPDAPPITAEERYNTSERLTVYSDTAHSVMCYAVDYVTNISCVKVDTPKP